MSADGGATEDGADESQRLLPPESAGTLPQLHDSAPQLAHSACWAVAALGLVAWCWILMFAGWQTMEVLLSTFRDELGYYALVFVYAGIVPGSLVTPCTTYHPFHPAPPRPPPRPPQPPRPQGRGRSNQRRLAGCSSAAWARASPCSWRRCRTPSSPR